MSVDAVALLAAAGFLAYAVAWGRQAALMSAVLAYAGMVGWIVLHHLDMLAIALVVAIALGLVGLGRVLYRTVLVQGGGEVEASRKLRTSSRSVAQNVGS